MIVMLVENSTTTSTTLIDWHTHLSFGQKIELKIPSLYKSNIQQNSPLEFRSGLFPTRLRDVFNRSEPNENAQENISSYYRGKIH